MRYKEFQYDNGGNPTRTHWSNHHNSYHQPDALNQLTSAFGHASGKGQVT